MARYIDADKFIKQFERALEHQQKYGLYNHAKLTEYVMKSIENEPTTDVAPKSEVLRLQSEVNRLKKYDEERDIALHARLISETKIETAREIFEEIEKAHDDCIEIGSRNVGFLKVNKFELMLAELKKKYIGE